MVPHDYVPYEVGRNYVDEPGEETDSALGIVSRTALEVNLLTEDNLPYYHLALWEIFGLGGVWGEWVRRWTAVPPSGGPRPGEPSGADAVAELIVSDR